MNRGQLLRSSVTFLESHGIKNAHRQAEIVITDALSCTLSDLYLYRDVDVTPEQKKICETRLLDRSKGVPPVYLQGSMSFMDLSLTIDPRVLIPRPETEYLVELIVKRLQTLKISSGFKVLDLCTGSGCIGICLKKMFPSIDVTLSDISLEALEVAQKNAIDNEVQVNFVQGDGLAPFKNKEKFSLIVCNPPYLSQEELELADKELHFEPEIALVSGKTGYEFFEFLAVDLPFVLEKGQLWLEMGMTQGAYIEKLFPGGRVISDLSGKDRFFFLEIV